MIGIDVVDLSDPLLRKRGLRAFQLIKHPLEEMPGKRVEKFFWAHWTAKEAVYKCLRTKLPFAPQHIRIRFGSNFSFTATADLFSGKSFIGSVNFDPGYVLAIACDASIESFHYQVVALTSQSQSVEIRRKVASHFQSLYNEPAFVQSGEGSVPLLLTKSGKQKHRISLSHHGNYGAFVYTPISGFLEKNC